MRNAMRGSRVRVWVYVHPNVRFDRVSSSVEGLEVGCRASAELYDLEGDAGEAMGADLS